jgi:hypothetical protein
MAQSPVIYAPVAKRSEIGGIIADLEERTRQARADLAHIDATLRMFDPDAIPQQIRGKRPTRGRSGLFANGEISRRVRAALGDASQPISAESPSLNATRSWSRRRRQTPIPGQRRFAAFAQPP